MSAFTEAASIVCEACSTSSGVPNRKIDISLHTPKGLLSSLSHALGGRDNNVLNT